MGSLSGSSNDLLSLDNHHVGDGDEGGTAAASASSTSLAEKDDEEEAIDEEKRRLDQECLMKNQSQLEKCIYFRTFAARNMFQRMALLRTHHTYLVLWVSHLPRFHEHLCGGMEEAQNKLRTIHARLLLQAAHEQCGIWVANREMEALMVAEEREDAQRKRKSAKAKKGKGGGGGGGNNTAAAAAAAAAEAAAAAAAAEEAEVEEEEDEDEDEDEEEEKDAETEEKGPRDVKQGQGSKVDQEGAFQATVHDGTEIDVSAAEASVEVSETVAAPGHRQSSAAELGTADTGAIDAEEGAWQTGTSSKNRRGKKGGGRKTKGAEDEAVGAVSSTGDEPKATTTTPTGGAAAEPPKHTRDGKGKGRGKGRGKGKETSPTASPTTSVSTSSPPPSRTGGSEAQITPSSSAEYEEPTFFGALYTLVTII